MTAVKIIFLVRLSRGIFSSGFERDKVQCGLRGNFVRLLISYYLIVFLLPSAALCQELSNYDPQVAEVYLFTDIPFQARIDTLLAISEREAELDPELAYWLAEYAEEVAHEINDDLRHDEAMLAQGNAVRLMNKYGEALRIYASVLSSSMNLQNEVIEFRALEGIADTYADSGEVRWSLEYFKRMVDRTKQSGNKRWISRSVNNIGFHYWEIGQFKEAYTYFRQAMRIREEIGDKRGLSQSYNNLGAIYWKWGNFESALENFLKSYELRVELQDDRGIALMLNNIGRLYARWDRDDEALANFSRAARISENLGDAPMAAYALRNTGNLFEKWGQYKTAERYYLDAFQVYDSLGHAQDIVLCANYLGKLYGNTKEYDKSETYFDIAYNLARNTGYKFGETTVLSLRGQMQVQAGRYREALRYLQRSLEFAQEENLRELIRDNYMYIANAYTGLNDYERALSMHKLYNAYNDSLLNNEVSMKMAELESEFEAAQREKENELLRKNNTIQELEIERQQSLMILLGVIIIAVLSVALLTYYRFRQNRRLNELLREKGMALNEANVKLHKLNNELESRVKARTKELEKENQERRRAEEALKKALRKAEEMSVMKANFLANMSHELRTPMNGILGFSSLLKEKLEGSSSNMAGKIEESARRLMMTLNSILEFSTLESSDEYDLTDRVKLADTVRSVIENQRQPAVRKGIAVSFDAIDNDIEIFGKEELVRRLTVCLVENAVKYTNKGFVKARVTTVERNLQRWAELSISDSGIGIEEHHIELIFEEFRQVSEGFSRSYEGSGLGLTIVKRIIELLKGKIEVESTPGEGSTFTLLFPLAPPEDIFVLRESERFVEEAAGDGRITAPDGSPLHILVVEDNEINREVTQMFLADICKLDLAHNGKEAVRKCEEQPYNAVFMDINLGYGLTGIEAARRIQKIKGFEEIPMVAVTGYTLGSDRENLLKEGFTHYIPKPYSRNDLIDLLKQIFNGTAGA